ncbi:MAG TPA: 4-(cytidine 5'-diphospho)-2-C-methyl-D-erythritol kinase [Planctomycetota bacterium]|nr:4-(cytidine 5'-diphospho)-2-C-methyl-D-erythritol kinase [Planctomycetota bacterium]
MKISRTGPNIRIQAPAKLNLFLEVLRKRPDGYHDIESVLQTISIYDELTLEPHGSEIRLVTDSADIPTGGDNLVVKAAELLRTHTGSASGATIRLEKRIPVSAGLGGGSSDAAATLVGLDRLWELKLPLEVLHDLAARLGSDVPFFLYGGTAICRGRGERVTPLEGVPAMTYVLVCPALKVSTKDIYENLPPRDLTRDSREIKLFSELLINRAQPGAVPPFFNRLASVTLKRHEPLKHLAQRMTDCGLAAVTMTGSGSAFFGIATSRKEATDIAQRLTRMNVGEVFIAQSIP